MSSVSKWFGFGRDDRYDAGVRAYERGEFDDAAAEFGACLSSTRDPTLRRLSRFYLGQCRSRLGSAALKAGDAERAVAQFEEAVELHPAYPDLHYHLAESLAATGDADGEERELRIALELNPDYAQALLRVGLIAYGRARHDEALELIARAVRLGRGAEPEGYASGAGAHRAGDHARALAAFQAMKVEPVGAAHQQAESGDAHAGAKRFVEAAHAYESALAMEPDYADVRCRYGQTLLELDRVAEAAEQFAAALAINPRYADAHACLGIAHRRLGRREEAKRAFSRALEIEPDHPVASVEAGRL